MTFNIRGVIEGFYGFYYTFSERNDLIEFLGNNNFNYYIYAPKNDRQHRDFWREPYPEKVIKKFAETVAVARNNSVKFNYALSPISICYSSQKDIKIVKEKLLKFYQIGVRDFSLLVDDISHSFPHQEDNKIFVSSAEAHAYLTNQIYKWLQKLDDSCNLLICPTDYHGKPPFSDYLEILGSKLHPDIDIFFTGPEICSEKIDIETVSAFAKVSKRKPLIWDNYPVNDLAMQSQLHIGPIKDRDRKLDKEVKGFVVNTMIQAEASKIPLLCFKDYFENPLTYSYESSWDKAILEIIGQDGLEYFKTFAENSLESCLQFENASKLKGLVDSLLIKFIKRDKIKDSKELKKLEKYLDEIDSATYYLLNWMDNDSLRNELLPWIDLLKHKYWMAKRALKALVLWEENKDYQRTYELMKESRTNVENHKKEIAGKSMELLADYIENIIR